jgi:hypothetical protein
MSSGVTDKMRELSKQMRWRTLEPREQRPRDRSLRGKARRRARRSAA